MRQRSVCVFCGASTRLDEEYPRLAGDVGRRAAAAGLRVVYGGASVGMMGALADAALAAGAPVLGVLPSSLADRELAHRGLTELRVVDSMHTRKKLMADESDAFVALPGGYGTLDELFEILTWRQILLHEKPIAIVNYGGFYDPLLAWVRDAVARRFVPEHVAAALEVLPDLAALERFFAAIPAPAAAPLGDPR